MENWYFFANPAFRLAYSHKVCFILSVHCSWACLKMGNLLGWTQQCNAMENEDVFAFLISACDSSVIAAIPATVALLFQIANWQNHWFLQSPDCLRSTSSDQPAEKAIPIRLHLSTYTSYFELKYQTNQKLIWGKERFNPTLLEKVSLLSVKMQQRRH